MKNCFHGALCAVAALLAPCAARAGFTTVDTLGPGDEGKTLKNNTVYKVTANATISRIGTTSSALYVEGGAKTVLYVPKGVTLNVYGGHASGTTSAGAGIRLNDGSTLIVTKTTPSCGWDW